MSISNKNKIACDVIVTKKKLAFSAKQNRLKSLKQELKSVVQEPYTALSQSTEFKTKPLKNLNI